jgi:hypothetical protein
VYDRAAARQDVHDDVDAPGRSSCLGEQTLDIELGGKVGVDRDRRAASEQDLLDRGLILQVDHTDRVAAAREFARDLMVRSRRTSGDDDHRRRRRWADKWQDHAGKAPSRPSDPAPGYTRGMLPGRTLGW